MTEILPTLRRSLPTPIALAEWPAHTEATTDDVTVSGISLRQYVDLCGTPCVLTGDDPILDSRHPELTGTRTVVAMKITVIVDTPEHRAIALTDSWGTNLDACWSECRLIGRVSIARLQSFELIPGELGAPALPYPVAALPSDLHAGDLLAVPSRSSISLAQLRPSHATELRSSGTVSETGEELS